MARIPEHIVENIREVADIYDIVSEYVRLKKIPMYVILKICQKLKLNLSEFKINHHLHAAKKIVNNPIIDI